MARTYVVLLIFCLLSACHRPALDESEEEAHGRPPNIIYILADDLGYGDLGAYGQQLIQTPNIDRMAREGMLFTQHYAGSTVCAPSRSVLMTGLHTGHTRIRGNASVPLAPEDTTVAELLQQAGYVTGLIGKWGLGETEDSGAPNRQGFDYFYGFVNQIHAHNSYPNYLWENDRIDSLSNKVLTATQSYAKDIGGVAYEKNEHVQDLFLAKTLDFLQRHRDTSFFLYLPFTLPHANNEARHWDSIGIEVPELGIYHDKDWPDAQRAHAAAITYLDQHVGRVLAVLDSLGLADNTLVIFTSDNGPHEEGGAKVDFFDSNGPLRGQKRDLYEGGIRVPFIARWPGHILASSRTEHPSGFWDFMATARELAGLSMSANTDGISYLPTLLGQEQPAHDYLYWEFFEQGGKQAVRQEQWKLIKLNVNGAAPLVYELYDLSEDVGEENNLAGRYPEKVEALDRLIEAAHVYSPDFNFPFERENQ